MQAVQVFGSPKSPQIRYGRAVAKPQVKGTGILVKVHAAGVTADELQWPELYQSTNGIPGHDVSGVVAAVGPDYDGALAIGHEVFAFLAAETGEGQADYVVCTPQEVAPKPVSITHAEAAALPIPVLTAWEALADHVSVPSRSRILVTGASGAVGSIFIQLAKHQLNANIVALASTRHKTRLIELGASEVVDYDTPGWEEGISEIDLVFDTVGSDVLSKSWKTVQENGTVITVADPPPPWANGAAEPLELASRPKVKYVYFIVAPSNDRLREISRMVDDGDLKALPVKAFQAGDAEQAWSCAQQRGRDYKVAIKFAD